MRAANQPTQRVDTTLEELVAFLQDACRDDDQVVDVVEDLIERGYLIWADGRIRLHRAA